ncbi:hypothetical protein [Stenotrophomonas sp. YAU14D1_LEIMI4_1]|uniref:hypothetical protein n=1 Tax=Stenotrophomonas sp. YAU14D1_LEIMI4_1 TaxID=2072407 RepID=UPI000D53C3C0|nr:hypothetical protein [Stenotrophomonas sp. YAU14D1_LEIMI4_1]AWH24485.1 hypothetical protein C1932_04880 [Stenotrophomonas sp. YAU14D1_LEIMI4_1]
MAIKHPDVLKLLAAANLVEAIDSDVKRCAHWARLAPQAAERAQAQIGAEVIGTVLLRWNCILHAAPSEVAPLYVHTTALALAVCLHRQGFADVRLTDDAITAIAALNAAVALTDTFHRRSAEIEALLRSTPLMPARRPSVPKANTAWRAGDVVGMQVAGRHHAFYVLKINGDAPIVEFYDIAQDTPLAWEQLQGVVARGERLNDGRDYVDRHALYGLQQQPDPAHQFRLLASGVEHGPDNAHLARHDGLYAVSDIFRIARQLLP